MSRCAGLGTKGILDLKKRRPTPCTATSDRYRFGTRHYFDDAGLRNEGEEAMYLENNSRMMAVIARPKLSGMGEHYGVWSSDGTVAHNTRERGVEVVSTETFAAGRPLRIERYVPTSEHQAVLLRIHQELAHPMAYDLISNNCETFANRVTGQRPESPQVQGFTIAMMVGAFAWMAAA